MGPELHKSPDCGWDTTNSGGRGDLLTSGNSSESLFVSVRGHDHSQKAGISPRNENDRTGTGPLPVGGSLLRHDSARVRGTRRRMNPRGLAATLPVPAKPSRRTLRDVEAVLLRHLKDGQNGDVIGLDVAAGPLRASQLAEVLERPLLLIVQRNRLATPRPRLTYLLGLDPEGENAWEAGAALQVLSERHRESLVAVWRSAEGGPDLVGRVEPAVAETYRFVLNRPEGASTRQFAEEIGITIQAASNRFSRAAGLGVIHPARREPSAGGGVRWVYEAVQ